MTTYLYYIVISLGYGVLSYLISQSYVCAGVISGLFMLFGFLYICPVVNKYISSNKSENNSYAFINRFVICYSTTNDEEKAFDNGVSSFKEDKEFQRINDQMIGFNTSEKLNHLKGYFGTNYYSVFVSLHSLYLEQGGNYLNILDSLLKEGTFKQQESLKVNKSKRRILAQFLTLWITSILIMLFVRYGLRGFYDNISSLTSFVAVTYLYFLLTLISLCLFVHKYTGLKFNFKLLGEAYGKF